MNPSNRLHAGLASALALLLLALAVGCAGGKKKAVSPAELSAEALYKRGVDLLSRRKLRQAINALGRVQYSADSRQEIEPLTRLAIADATFYQGNNLALIDARSLYLDFVTLYGNHRLAPYAQVQVGACSLKQVNHPSRDQSQTFRAINDLEQVERRYPDSPFVRASQALMRRARANLAESEFLIGRFYLKKKSYAAAAERFRVIENRFPDFNENEKVLFHLGQALLMGGNAVEGRLYLDRLMNDYPEGLYVDQARKALGNLSP